MPLNHLHERMAWMVTVAIVSGTSIFGMGRIYARLEQLEANDGPVLTAKLNANTEYILELDKRLAAEDTDRKATDVALKLEVQRVREMLERFIISSATEHRGDR